MSDVPARTAIHPWIEKLLADGRQVAGPHTIKPGIVQYTWLSSADQLASEGFVRPNNSIKEFVFPRHEKLYGYQFKGKGVELIPIEPPEGERVIFAARPCDAAALEAVDNVFHWDSKEPAYDRRRELTTIVTIACREFDAHCFCTSVGIGPVDPRGSDVLLVPIDDETFEVRCITEKGRRLVESLKGAAAGLSSSAATTAPEFAGPPVKFELSDVGEFLAGNYDSPVWRDATLVCLGCGACAFSCPTCHCFDIVDEGNSSGGFRVRNWDACQFSLFTVHASGHNPRNSQADRQRQRIFHKFQIYPDKFGELLCTGCGNCSRHCPAGLGFCPSFSRSLPRKHPPRHE